MLVLGLVSITTIPNSPLAILSLVIGLSFFTKAIYSNVDSVVGPWLDSYSTSPNITLLVCFNKDQCVQHGDFVPLESTFDRPLVKFYGYDVREDERYCYMMLDSDQFHPKHPYARNFVHWLVCGISGSNELEKNGIDDDLIQTGMTMVPYARPRKPFFTFGSRGVHRYYNLLFKQADVQQEFEEISEMAYFSVREFSDTYRLGYPVAGVAFRIDYSPRPPLP